MKMRTAFICFLLIWFGVTAALVHRIRQIDTAIAPTGDLSSLAPAAGMKEAESGSLNVNHENTEKKTDSEPNKWTDPITLFTGLLVIVGILQWRVLARQSIILNHTEQASKRALDISEKSYGIAIDAASAAKKSVEAAIKFAGSAEKLS